MEPTMIHADCPNTFAKVASSTGENDAAGTMIAMLLTTNIHVIMAIVTQVTNRTARAPKNSFTVSVVRNTSGHNKAPHVSTKALSMPRKA
jgi:hypothetical protein